MSFFLGIDAGGTGTECVLADEEQVLARAHGGSIKVMRVSAERARETLRALLDAVARNAGMPLAEICATCVGISGLRVPAVRHWLDTSLGGMVGGEVILSGDDEVALDAAFPGQAGVVVIAGTGSNILARTSSGERVNVGGWGPALGDEGGGYWIGQQALREALHASDRGERTLLLERVAAYWHASSPGELIERAHALPAPDFAALAPLVTACAEAGDAVCLQVLTAAGMELAEAAALAFRRIRAREADPSTIAGVAFAGSILRSVGMVRDTMIENLRRLVPAVAIVPEAVDPVAGALWRARRVRC